jgi:hypothetical protein
VADGGCWVWQYNGVFLIGYDKQKREIISYAKENQKLTQQQIADNLTIKWDLPIKRRTVGDILNQKEFYESDNEGSPSRKCPILCQYM